MARRIIATSPEVDELVELLSELTRLDAAINRAQRPRRRLGESWERAIERLVELDEELTPEDREDLTSEESAQLENFLKYSDK